jgi:hypothetical protein
MEPVRQIVRTGIQLNIANKSMSSSTTFFQIMYQNETLFHLEEKAVETVIAPDANLKEIKEPETVSTTPARQEPPTPAREPIAASEGFPLLKHKILILTDEPKKPDLITSEAIFLDNILKAVGSSIENSDILNFSFLPGRDARTVLSEKKTNHFITFGVPLIKLKLDLLLVPYTPKSIDGIWFLLADPLAVIEADRNLKKKLWQALQKMFEMPS